MRRLLIFLLWNAAFNRINTVCSSVQCAVFFLLFYCLCTKCAKNLTIGFSREKLQYTSPLLYSSFCDENRALCFWSQSPFWRRPVSAGVRCWGSFDFNRNYKFFNLKEASLVQYLRRVVVLDSWCSVNLEKDFIVQHEQRTMGSTFHTLDHFVWLLPQIAA